VCEEISRGATILFARSGTYLYCFIHVVATFLQGESFVSVSKLKASVRCTNSATHWLNFDIWPVVLLLVQVCLSHCF